MKKDWKGTIANKDIYLPMILLPFIFTVIMPVLILWSVLYDPVGFISEFGSREELMELLNVKDIDPEQQGIIRKIFRLILKIIKLPIRIIKKILRLLFRIATLPLRIFLFILEILTPFRDIKIFPFRCIKRFHHKH